MESRYLNAVMGELDVVWLAVALLTMLFFFFFLKVRFAKASSERAYGVLFYSFVAYSISALSYIFLQALDRFLRIQDDLYSDFLWFFPLNIFAALTGAAVGFLLHFAASKVAPGYAYRLLNLSLLVLVPLFFYVLLFKPYYETFRFPVDTKEIITPAEEINLVNAEDITSLPEVEKIPAAPAQLFDSLNVTVKQGMQLQIINPVNGFTWMHRLPVKQVEQLYVVSETAGRRVAILAVCAALQRQSALVVFDTLGMPVFQRIYRDGVNRLAVSAGLPELSVYRQENDSMVWVQTLRLH